MGREGDRRIPTPLNGGEDRHDPPGSEAPQCHRPVPAGARQRLAVRGEGDRKESALLFQTSDLPPCGDIPQYQLAGKFGMVPDAAPGGQGLAIRRERHAANASSVADESGNLLFGGDLPQPYFAVVSPCCEEPAVRRKRERRKGPARTCTSLEDPRPWPGSETPELHRLVVTTGGQRLAVGGEGNAQNLSGMPFEGGDLLTRGDGIHLQCR